MHHALGAQLVVLAVTRLLEAERIGLAQRAVIALAVGVAEVPPAPRHVVIEHAVFRSFLVIADRVMAAAQHQLVRQAQGAVPLKAGAPLLLASAFLPVVIARQAGAPGLLRVVFHQHRTAADGFAGGQFHLGLVGWQAVELVDGLLDFPQVEQVAVLARKGHGQLARRELAVVRALQTFELAFDHQHLQMPFGQILLRQVGTASDHALVDVVIGDGLEQLIELGNAQALVDVRLDQALTLGGGQAVSALEFNGLDRETTVIHRGGGRCGFDFLAGQFLEVFEAPALLFEQAVLPLADQVLIARRSRGHCAV